MITYSIRTTRAPDDRCADLPDAARASIDVHHDSTLHAHADAVAMMMQVAGLNTANIIAAFDHWLGENQSPKELADSIRTMWGAMTADAQQELAGELMKGMRNLK